MSGLHRDINVYVIFYHLEDSRSHGNEREAERDRGQGARPPPLGARPATGANRLRLVDYAPPT